MSWSPSSFVGGLILSVLYSPSLQALAFDMPMCNELNVKKAKERIVE